MTQGMILVHSQAHQCKTTPLAAVHVSAQASALAGASNLCTLSSQRVHSDTGSTSSLVTSLCSPFAVKCTLMSVVNGLASLCTPLLYTPKTQAEEGSWVISGRWRGECTGSAAREGVHFASRECLVHPCSVTTTLVHWHVCTCLCEEREPLWVQLPACI